MELLLELMFYTNIGKFVLFCLAIGMWFVLVGLGERLSK